MTDLIVYLSELLYLEQHEVSDRLKKLVEPHSRSCICEPCWFVFARSHPHELLTLWHRPLRQYPSPYRRQDTREWTDHGNKGLSVPMIRGHKLYGRLG